MKDIVTIMKFTIKDMARRKSFIISTLIILIMIVIGFNVPNIISSFNGDTSLGEKLVIVDKENVFEGNLELIKQADSGYEIEIANKDEETIKKEIEEEKIDAAIIIEKQDPSIKIRYILKDTTMMYGVPEGLMSAFDSLYTNIQIGKLGLTESEIASLSPNFEYTLEQSGENEAQGNIFVMMILSIVLFYAIYFCAYQVSSSITTEKTSKIIETLVTSTSPRNIVLGKTIGIGIVGLLQLSLIIATALISAKSFLDEELLNSVLDMSNITPYLGFITIVYFLLGYFAFSMFYALTGSTVSKPEDIQSANGPVAIIAVLSFYLAYFTMMNPTSELNVFASMFPLSAPFCMPFRIMMGLASTTDVIISIAILIVTILLIAKVTIKIYSNAILNYGSKMNLKDIINIYKSK